MSSLRSHEGYLLIDHRYSPGVPDEVMVPLGMPIGSGHRVFESATFTCSHCETVVVMNPDRSRERGYCKKCDHLVCDACETLRVQTGVCFPYKARIEEMMNAIAAKPASSEVFQSPTIILP